MVLQSFQVFSKQARLSSTNHKSNIDKLVRSERRYKSQQLILKVFFLPSVRVHADCVSEDDSRHWWWFLSKNNLSEVWAEPESDTVIIGGSPGEESCGLVLHI